MLRDVFCINSSFYSMLSINILLTETIRFLYERFRQQRQICSKHTQLLTKINIGGEKYVQISDGTIITTRLVSNNKCICNVLVFVVAVVFFCYLEKQIFLFYFVILKLFCFLVSFIKFIN